MRVAIANWNRRIVGGSEAYLKSALWGLGRADVECALLTEIDAPSGRAPLEMPAGSPRWCLSEMGAAKALDALREWRPDVIFVHIVKDTELEAKLIEIAPSVLFAHSHQGMCISGAKTFKFPEVRPCARRFGWQCLVQFYPRRCGGLNPMTMWRDYSAQMRKHSMLTKYSAIVTASKYLAGELEKHGISRDRLHTIAMPIGAGSTVRVRAGSARPNESPTTPRLLFVGRMSYLKGGSVLLDAIPQVVAALGTPVRITFVGDGPSCGAWEERAKQLASIDRRIEATFTGWLDSDAIESIFDESDLLVMPSLEPETFGLAGPEAGRAGIPAVAFDVGGISEWLIDDVNGCLAPGNPPRAEGLAAAIVRCLRDRETYERLRRGAIEASNRFDTERHVESLLAIFRKVTACPL
ncbi:MAG: glycosyltransferase family 4 protein [Candidatus Binatus sp.]|uniref:glycosyltransferase family 4 protein n=1 Tax=Candidatus Binatus sp. TaxID=2811406 RepID=UPI002716D0D7|nr:glycosyltransferase family 4 protein [Candidatus Binatus sp.]MDO8431591.1 glycosyltransferase family 4 protein [Candidatus Binatus sp.]